MAEINRPETVYSWSGPPSLELLREPVVLPSGLRYTGHRLITAGGRDGVVTIARQNDHVLFVRTFRPAIGREVLELPRGFGESDPADPDGRLTDAVRELHEETGYRAHSPRSCGGYTIDTSLLPGHVTVVECTVDGDASPETTDGETMGAQWVPRQRIGELVAEGILCDAHTLSALALAVDLWRS